MEDPHQVRHEPSGQDIRKLEQVVESGAKWFHILVVIGLLNIVIGLFGYPMNFVVINASAIFAFFASGINSFRGKALLVSISLIPIGIFTIIGHMP